MTNENELKVGDFVRERFEISFRARHLDEDLSNTLLEFDALADRYKIGYTNESYLSWQYAIKSQQSRIELLESAIRKLINRKLDRFSNQVTKDQEVNLAIVELRNLMEQAK